MPSIIPGYEYDIFISYRQKDNKYDGWVTEFVNHLKDDLGDPFLGSIEGYRCFQGIDNNTKYKINF